MKKIQKTFDEILENTRNIKSKDLITYYNLENKNDEFKNAYNRGVEDAKERFLTFLTVFSIKNNL
ncbi:hypothetical protein K9M42_01400 [Patescibacteria group bacterium]|nr:hypothetical protein [Patescibacteria group bacterium]